MVIKVIVWYLAIGLGFYWFLDFVTGDQTFQNEIVHGMERNNPGHTSGSYWLVLVATIVVIWPILVVCLIRGFFKHYYRNLIDIFSNKKGANNETHGKNQEDTGKE